ncbi:MAG: hypothetical protein SV375_05115 [Thermodesulfobacteriota bacterium]|nr:hypothetical protein [Thermodesulfobacteriota bacterium]
MVVSGKGLFTAEEVVKWMQKFLQNAGYVLLPPLNSGHIQPDFLAMRKESDAIYELAGVVCQDIGNASDGLIKLKEIKDVIGVQADYVLVCPPLSEYFIIEFLTTERGKRYFFIKDERFMVWIGNPERETTTCLIGGPRDAVLGKYFVKLGIASFDTFIGMRLSQMIMTEEEEEEIGR